MIGTGRVWGTAAGMAPRLIHSPDPEAVDQLDDRIANSCQRKSGSAPVRTRTSRPPAGPGGSASSGHVSCDIRPSTISSVGRRAR